MEELSSLLKKTLAFLEPNADNWESWLSETELEPVSQSECMKNFVAVINQIKEDKKKVKVLGNFDCGSMLATVILSDGLRSYGIKCAYDVPERFQVEKGLYEQKVDVAYHEGYRAIVIVDNGINLQKVLKRASELNMNTIVISRHFMNSTVVCDALVHPFLMEEAFSTLCTSGMAYECMRALQCASDYHLQFAAIGSVADAMAAVGQTRALIQNGIKSLNKYQFFGKTKRIFDIVYGGKLNEKRISRELVPTIRMIGRIFDAADVKKVIGYFLTDNKSFVEKRRKLIIDTYEIFKDIKNNIYETAKDQISGYERVLFVANPTFSKKIWILSDGDDIEAQVPVDNPCFRKEVIHSTAWSLCFEYGKPVVIIDGNKGFMCAPEGFACKEFLQDFSLISQFTGNEAAVDFSMDEIHAEEFKEYVFDHSKSYIWEPVYKTVLIEPSDVKVDSVESLEKIKVFGYNHRRPSYEIVVPGIRKTTDINRMHRKYYLHGSALECIDFNQTTFDWRQDSDDIYSFIGYPYIDEYEGRKSPVFKITKIRYKEYSGIY